ncbi:MAG: EVE domain-containing protein [Bdellovibrionales bacterium]|nr:EVE domain-containing protein [Bdellovibrionales bacterium]
MKYWLFKSEPETYSIDKLKKEKSTLWDGVRNYQARNFMINDMQLGDLVLFYHSNANPPGIIGLAEISELAQPDPSQFNKSSPYYDPKSSIDKPRWHCVKVKFKKKFKHLISLDQLKENKALKEMLVVKKGQRLSIQPVDKKHFEYILKWAEE